MTAGTAFATHRARTGHLPTVGAAEVVRVVGIILEHEGLFIDGEVAPLADEFAQALGLLAVVARPAEVPVGGKRNVRENDPFTSASPQNSPAVS